MKSRSAASASRRTTPTRCSFWSPMPPPSLPESICASMAARSQPGGRAPRPIRPRARGGPDADASQRGARVGLITTRGFEDTLIIARGPVGRAGGLPQSKAMDFLHTEPPPPLVPKALIRGVSERIVADGTVLARLNEAEVRAAIAT